MKKRIVLLLALAACGGSSATAPDPNAGVFGTYALVTHNGANLPTDGIVSGEMRLLADHYEFAYSGAGQPNVYTERGTWRLDGSAIVLHSMTAVNWQTPPDWTGTVSAGTLSMNAESNPSWTRLHPAMVFKR